jgi:hypothetical protein
MSFIRKFALIATLLGATELLILLFAGKLVDWTASMRFDVWGVSLPELLALVLGSALVGALGLLALLALIGAVSRRVKRAADASTSRWMVSTDAEREPATASRVLGPQPLAIPRRALATFAGVAGVSTLGIAAILVATQAVFGAGVAALAFLLPVLVTLLIALAGSWLWPALRRARTAELSLDEGGIRIAIDGRMDYWEYALLGGASVERSRFGLEQLSVVDRDARSVVKIPLLASAQEQAARSLARELNRAVAATRRAERVPEAIHRRGRPLADWCADMDRWVRRCTSDHYRSNALDRETLVELLKPESSAELRAGSTYALLSSGDPTLVDAAMDSLAGDCPPLVLAMAELATDGPLPEPLRMKSALDFLDGDDRTAVLALLSERRRPRAKLRVAAHEREPTAELVELVDEREEHSDAGSTLDRRRLVSER